VAVDAEALCHHHFNKLSQSLVLCKREAASHAADLLSTAVGVQRLEGLQERTEVRLEGILFALRLSQWWQELPRCVGVEGVLLLGDGNELHDLIQRTCLLILLLLNPCDSLNDQVVDSSLLAVGVVDVLPYCLSSVYFFYDPDYHSLSLGVYSALKEIDWVKSAHTTTPELKFYYLGFYIHTCPKMKYKGDYHPSDLLCLSSFQWVPLEELAPKLDQTSSYFPFVSDKSKHENMTRSEALQLCKEITIWVNKQFVHYSQLTSQGRKIMEPKLLQYLDKVGPELAKNMIYAIR